jgi:double-stranded uracil-DNA glycosylase
MTRAAQDIEGGTIAPDAATLPDLLQDGLDIVFVGINPSPYAVAHGHYFARPTNRFWPCFSRSVLSAGVRAALGVERLAPVHDRALGAHGFGFTDLAKRPTARADALAPGELADGVGGLAAKLARYRPRIACLHGMTVLRHVHAALGEAGTKPVLGRQALRIGATRVFAVPNPSPANAHFTPADQILWYDKLAAWLGALAAEAAP